MSVRDLLMAAAGNGGVVFIGAESTKNTVNGDTLTIAMPGTVVDGVLLVAFVATDGQGLVWNTPSGWTLAVSESYLNDGNGCSQAIFYKIASSEGANQAFTLTSASNKLGGSILAFANAQFAYSPFDRSVTTNPVNTFSLYSPVDGGMYVVSGFIDRTTYLVAME